MRGKKPTLPPFSLRLTFEERAALEEAAGDTPLPAMPSNCVSFKRTPPITA